MANAVIVLLDSQRWQVSVMEVDDLKALRVEVIGAVSRKELVALLGDLGRLDEEHVWLSVQALRAAAMPRTDRWLSDYSAMIDYAGTKGWTDEDGLSVRAHLIVRD
jgi:hypothetical protein